MLTTLLPADDSLETNRAAHASFEESKAHLEALLARLATDEHRVQQLYIAENKANLTSTDCPCVQCDPDERARRERAIGQALEEEVYPESVAAEAAIKEVLDAELDAAEASVEPPQEKNC